MSSQCIGAWTTPVVDGVKGIADAAHTMVIDHGAYELKHGMATRDTVCCEKKKKKKKKKKKNETYLFTSTSI
jgi:hypothetical protein